MSETQAGVGLRGGHRAVGTSVVGARLAQILQAAEGVAILTNEGGCGRGLSRKQGARGFQESGKGGAAGGPGLHRAGFLTLTTHSNHPRARKEKSMTGPTSR